MPGLGQLTTPHYEYNVGVKTILSSTVHDDLYCFYSFSYRSNYVFLNLFPALYLTKVVCIAHHPLLTPY